MTFEEEYEQALAQRDAAQKAVDAAQATGTDKEKQQAAEALQVAEMRLQDRKRIVNSIEMFRIRP